MADVAEADYLELRRSSRTEVSQNIAAIDDHRVRVVERRCRVPQDSADRNVNRAAEMRGVVFVRGQDIDDLRVAWGEHPEKFAMLDLAHESRAHRG